MNCEFKIKFPSSLAERPSGTQEESKEAGLTGRLSPEDGLVGGERRQEDKDLDTGDRQVDTLPWKNPGGLCGTEDRYIYR